MPPLITILNITDQEATALGITIFDITNPSHVSYCFVDFTGMESARKVPLMTPLSARTYLEAYYELTEDHLPLLQSFQGRDLIPASVLEDAWPEQGWKEAETDVQQGEGGEQDLKLEKLENAPRARVDSLRTKAMDICLQSVLDLSENDSCFMAEAELLTDFLPRLKDELYDRATNLEWSSYHLDLLCQALQNEVEVDLSPLSNISAKDLALVVAKLYKNGKMSTLNLSNRPDISLEDLHFIIGTDTRLRVLCLLEMPQIPVQSLGRYLVNHEVHHSDLLRWALRNYPFSDVPISHERVPNTESPGTGVVSQIVWTGLEDREIKERRNYLPNGRIAWENLTFHVRKERTLRWPKSLEIRTYDLCVPLPPCRLIPGVLRLLQWAGSAELSYDDSLSKGMACSLASSLPCTNGTGHGISLLSPSLYLDRKSDDAPAGESCPLSLKAGEWALFLVSEAFDVSDEIFVADMSSDDGDYEVSSGYIDVDFSQKMSSKEAETEPGTFAEDSLADNLSERMDRADTLTQAEGAKAIAQAPETDPAAHKNQDFKFYPRKATSYALITRVAESGPSQYMVADIPTYLKKVLGDTSEAQELIAIWTSRISSIQNAEFFGDDTYKILRKLSPEDSTLKRRRSTRHQTGSRKLWCRR